MYGEKLRSDFLLRGEKILRDLHTVGGEMGEKLDYTVTNRKHPKKWVAHGKKAVEVAVQTDVCELQKCCGCVGGCSVVPQSMGVGVKGGECGQPSTNFVGGGGMVEEMCEKGKGMCVKDVGDGSYVSVQDRSVMGAADNALEKLKGKLLGDVDGSSARLVRDF